MLSSSAFSKRGLVLAWTARPSTLAVNARTSVFRLIRSWMPLMLSKPCVTTYEPLNAGLPFFRSAAITVCCASSSRFSSITDSAALRLRSSTSLSVTSLASACSVAPRASSVALFSRLILSQSPRFSSWPYSIA